MDPGRYDCLSMIEDNCLLSGAGENSFTIDKENEYD